MQRTMKNSSDSPSNKLCSLLRDDALHTLRGRKRVQHILTYYKFPLAVICIALFFIGQMVYGHFNRKDILLYTALVNVNTGETLTRQLGADFMEHLEADEQKYAIQLYTGLYLTDDELNEWHEYTYASRMKILSAIEGRMMDVVLMNQEAFDAFSQSGYLLDLDDFLSVRDPELYQTLKPSLTTNIIILEDNKDDMVLDSALAYTAVTEEHHFGLNISETSYIQQAGFDDTVYLGIIANTPRKDTVVEYLRYLVLPGNHPACSKDE